jgi:serine-type D-Ala-D-Ala carboxypeptidase (penicillin-binding protein 5/6)
MRRWYLCIFFLVISGYGAESLRLSLQAEAALLMNAKTGRVLFEKNGYSQVYPASTTKIATALLALHKSQGNLDQIIIAERDAICSISPQAKKQSNYRSPPHWIESDSTHIGIKKGEEFRLFDLLHGMMVASGNDAANVIALGLGGTISQYMDEVNSFLKEIGCQKTHFNNPHGLHHPEHVTTAYDLALMARRGLQNPIFRKIVSTVRYVCPQTNLVEERILGQTNLLLKNGTHNYPKAIGIKTGYTQTAGKNLVAAASSEDREIIAVAMGYRGSRSELYQDVIKMFEAAFNEPKMRKQFIIPGEQKWTAKVQAARGVLRTYLTEGLAYEFYPSEEEAIKIALLWEIPPLPIVRGSCVGKVRLIGAGQRVLKEASLLALSDLTPTLWYRIRLLFHNAHLRQCLFIGAAVFVIFFLWKVRRKR